jgi:amino-acid N-acetyltransferase
MVTLHPLSSTSRYASVGGVKRSLVAVVVLIGFAQAFTAPSASFGVVRSANAARLANPGPVQGARSSFASKLSFTPDDYNGSSEGTPSHSRPAHTSSSSATSAPTPTPVTPDTSNDIASAKQSADAAAATAATAAAAAKAAEYLFEQALNDASVPAKMAELADPSTNASANEAENALANASANGGGSGDHDDDVDGPDNRRSNEAAANAANTAAAVAAADEADIAASVSSAILSIDPATVEIVTVEASLQNPDSTQINMPVDAMQRLPFVNMFRGSANYIANHRNTLAIYHIPGGLLDLPSDSTVFRDLMNDIALTWLLGMKVVLVVGCRHQIEKRVGQGIPRRHGLRVTDEDTLRVVKEEAGYVRFEVERQLARSLRMQGGGASGSGGHGYYDGNVVSGNFYSAQPFGILDGVDYKFTGFVRRVEVEKIKQVHNSRDICLLTTLGVSPSGEVFNVNSESLAAAVAGQMEASKIVYFTEKEMELRSNVHGNKIQSLRVLDANNLLDHYGVMVQKRGFSELGPNHSGDKAAESDDMLLKIGWSVQAIQSGVKRAHIISPKHGALLQELYTRDGSGVLVSADLYEGIRQANVHDVSAIYDLIQPLILMGTLIDRPKSVLEKDIDKYYVYTRDDHIVACGQLKLFKEGFAEIGCLVVSKDYRSRGRGDAMLGYLERLSLLNGCSSIFVLSTQTMEWFVERGFELAGVDRLPPSRPYNHLRSSKIYMKKIESARDLDASELWWNR